MEELWGDSTIGPHPRSEPELRRHMLCSSCEQKTTCFLFVCIHQFSSQIFQKPSSFDECECKYEGSQLVCYALFIFVILKLHFFKIMIYAHTTLLTS